MYAMFPCPRVCADIQSSVLRLTASIVSGLYQLQLASSLKFGFAVYSDMTITAKQCAYTKNGDPTVRSSS